MDRKLGGLVVAGLTLAFRSSAAPSQCYDLQEKAANLEYSASRLELCARRRDFGDSCTSELGDVDREAGDYESAVDEARNDFGDRIYEVCPRR